MPKTWDPVAFVPNLFDAILVLTVALLVALSTAHAKAARATPDGRKLEGFVDTGVERAGQGNASASRPGSPTAG